MSQHVVIMAIENILSIFLENLTSKSAVLNGAYSKTDLHSVVSHIEPAVRKVELQHLRFIKETVAIHIMRSDVSRNMAEDDCAPLISHLKRGCDIEVNLCVAHHCSIDEERLLVCRLTMLHIDLTGHAFHAVDH